jgi:hypothetical protein
MGLREFTDGKGTAWRVRDTRPLTGRVRAEFQGGWITFEQGGRETTCRRLAPIPGRWEELPESELRRLCFEAPPERPRKWAMK